MIGPYHAECWSRDYPRDMEERWHVCGPHIAGGWHGTVPHSHDGMIEANAKYLAELMNLAFDAGKTMAQRQMRISLGLD